ncbi:uncharacterized protein C3orf20-like isoform X2 [Hyperolius riggenbachi]
MSSMMLKAGPVYFYDQPTTRAIKRTKKMPEELPSDMKYLNINPRLANFINGLNKTKKGLQHHVEKKHPNDEKICKEKYSVLPEISGPTLLKNNVEKHNHKLSQVITDEEQFMNPFDDYKYVAPTLLYELGKLLQLFSQYEIVFPQGVVNVLNYSWQELIEGVVYSKKHGQFSKKMMTDTSMGPEENDCKVSGHTTIPHEIVESIKTHKNKANTTLLEHTKEKAAQELSQSKPTGNRSPQSFIAHLPVTISFSMSSRLCEDKGWIFETKDSKDEEMEWKGLIAWALERLQLTQIQINKELSDLSEKGFCKPVILRHYNSTKKDPILKHKKSNKSLTFALENGKPRIPEIKRENPSLRKLHYALIDGSSMVYYPSGQVAVCQSYSGLSCGGFYTNIFAPEQNILGSFTPFGHGSICFPDSNVFILHYNQNGGVMTDKEGETIKEWDWPTKGKFSDPITLQVNEYLSIKISGQFSVSLTYKWQRETVRLSLSPLQDISPPQNDDLGQLLTGENFTSKTAKEMTKANRKKVKEKDAKRSPKKATILSELVKTLEIPEDQIGPSNDVSAATELRKLQRKIRNIADDWMEHYRLASGLASTDIQRMSVIPPKTPRKRKVQSAAAVTVTTPRPQTHPVMEPDVTSVPIKERPHLHGRFLSAPAHPYSMRWDLSVSSASPRPSSFSSNRKELTVADPSIHKNGSGLSVVSKSWPEAVLSVPESGLEQENEKLWHMSHNSCPVVLQKILLGEEGRICRCSNHQVPYVTDLEFDQLINNKSSSSDQIMVVCVMSALDAQEDHGPDVLDQLYEKMNRYRSMPCIQSRLDSFRLLKYDICTCSMYTSNKDPLLVQRHNAAPGMILMYICGKLMFANYIFNGYSRSIKDLQKQIVKTRSDYQTGYHLPSDFKFRLHLSLTNNQYSINCYRQRRQPIGGVTTSCYFLHWCRYTVGQVYLPQAAEKRASTGRCFSL